MGRRLTLRRPEAAGLLDVDLDRERGDAGVELEDDDGASTLFETSGRSLAGMVVSDTSRS